MQKQNKLFEDYRVRLYLDKSDGKYKSKKYDKIFGFDGVTYKLKENGKVLFAYLNNKAIMKLTKNEFGFVYKFQIARKYGYLEEYLKRHFYGKEIVMYNDVEDPFIDE